jgi:hypothetical protein
MLKTLLLVLLSTALCLGATGCKKKLTAAQQKAEQDKKWREEQRIRAAKYYDEIVKKYPDSEFAAKAKQRLQELGPVPTPAPKKK